MAKTQIRFPRLCAWCGTQPPSATREIKLHYTKNRMTSRLKFEAPICEACAAHAAAIEQASKLRTWVAVIGSFVVGLILPVLLLGPRGRIYLPTGIFVSFVLMVVVLIVMSVKKLKKLLNRRMAGEPPEGYASSDWQPCEMTGMQVLSFYNSTYQEQFAALNPGLV